MSDHSTPAEWYRLNSQVSFVARAGGIRDFFSLLSELLRERTHRPNSDAIGRKVDDKKRARRPDVDLVLGSMPGSRDGPLADGSHRRRTRREVIYEHPSSACLPAGVLMPSLLRE
jgi:hypothetical protein